MPGARLFAVVTGATEAAPDLVWLEKTVPVTPELLAKTAPIEPQRMLRIAVTCQEHACIHYDGADCKLARRIVDLVPAATDAAPRCAIRSTCRWFRQEGRAACLRCPLVATHTYDPPAALKAAAHPP